MHWLPRFACRALRSSPHVPRHVAFIMDGNRRYAQQHHAPAHQGHSMGYEMLKDTLEWCLELGVKMVTVYAFSIDNFKRSGEEVEQLMRLAKEKFIEMLHRLDIIEKHSCCVRVLGDLSLLPTDVREAMEAAVAASRHKTRVTLNVCMSYTHQRELTQAAGLIRGALDEGVLIEDDVNAALLQSSLYTGISAGLASEAAAASCAASACSAGESTACAPCLASGFVPAAPELLIRTSGETRLSDFLCFQSSADTQLTFTPTLWPSFSLWELGCFMLEYQRVAPQLEQRRRIRDERDRAHRRESDEQYVRRMMREERRQAQRELQATAAATARCDASFVAAESCDALVPAAEELDALSRSSSNLDSDVAAQRGASPSPSCSSSTSSSDARGSIRLPRGVVSASTSEESSSSSEHEGDADSSLRLRSVSATSASSASSSSACSDPPSAQHSPLSRSVQGSPAPMLDEATSSLRAYWRANGGGDRTLLHRRPAAAATRSNQKQCLSEHADADSLLDDDDDDDAVDDEEVQRRVALHAAERQQRLRAFARYAREHTTSLI